VIFEALEVSVTDSPADYQLHTSGRAGYIEKACISSISLSLPLIMLKLCAPVSREQTVKVTLNTCAP
jgi:hypothetical protein